MNEAEKTSSTERTRRAGRTSRAPSDGKAAEAAAPDGEAQAAGAKRTRARPGSPGARARSGRGKKRAGSLDQGLQEIIAPIFDDFSQAMLRAIDPVLQDVQKQMAELVAQRVEQILPMVRTRLQEEAQREVRDALLAMQRERERGGASEARATTQRREPPPGLSSPTGDTDQLVVERVPKRPHDHEQAQGGSRMTTETEQNTETDEESTGQSQPTGSGEAGETARAQSNQPAESDAGRTEEQGGGRTAQSSTSTRGNGDRQNGGSGRAPARRQSRSSQPTYFYDPQGAARAGLLNLATMWKESGALYQAIPAYMEILTNYPGTGAAAAATEGLVDLAHRLEEQGRFYTALSIFRKLEMML